MQKHIRYKIKWSVSIILFGLILWLSYDFYFKYVINDYQARQIEKQLQDNFYNNQGSFNELLIFSRQLNTLEKLEFRENEQIHFQVYDTLQDRTELAVDFISINSSFGISDIQFTDSNGIKVISEDQIFKSNSWVIDYEGEISNPFVEKLLSYNNISLDQLKDLGKKLDNANCQAFDKNDDLITIRFAGHRWESFNYLYPLTNNSDIKQWNKLEDNYYWQHYQHDLFCGWTNW